MNYPLTHATVPPEVGGAALLDGVRFGFGQETVVLVLSIILMAVVVWLLARLLDEQNQSVDLEVRRSIRSRGGRQLVTGSVLPMIRRRHG